MFKPNSDEEIFKDDDKSNPDDLNKDGTEEKKDSKIPDDEAEQHVDYKQKFGASTAENQRIMAENKAKDAEIERLKLLSTATVDDEKGKDSEELYPGFEQLDEEAQKNLIDYTEGITKSVEAKIQNDPAISFSRRLYNEKKFDDAFEATAKNFPELRETRDDFKSKYFQPNNVPENIESLLGDLAKVHLFDRARESGAEDERAKSDRIDLERGRGGDKTQPTKRTLEEWQTMAGENPAKFAMLHKEYQEDLDAGNLRE